VKGRESRAAIWYFANTYQGRKERKKEGRWMSASSECDALTESTVQCSAALAVFALHRADEFLRDWLID